MKLRIKLERSRDLRRYKPVLNGLVEDFGYIYYRAILEWCGYLGKSCRTFWRVWLITEGKEVIGLCGLYSLIPGTKELWLGWFGIIPAKRNSGRGGIVLNEIEEKAKRIGCKLLRTYVDISGKPLPFYQRNGFSRVSSVGVFVRRHGLNIEEFENPKDHVLEKHLR